MHSIALNGKGSVCKRKFGGDGYGFFLGSWFFLGFDLTSPSYSSIVPSGVENRISQY